jgi:hypothetical protein
MRIEGATNPFHVARVYGVQPPLRLARADTVERVAPRIDPHIEPTNASRLIAGSVPGRVDFSADTPRPSDPAAIPMYRHPADKNAAATAVTAGRTLDVRG